METMTRGPDVAVTRLLDEMCRYYKALLICTRRLATNFTPAALAGMLSERSSLLCLINSRRHALEKVAVPESYADFEQCRIILGSIAAIGALDRTISMLMAAHMSQIRSELAALPVSFRAARNYLRQSRINDKYQVASGK